MQDLKDRLLYRQAVETARCLAEGVLTTVHDGNIGSIFGIGFPAWTGGALQFIYGRAWTPSPRAPPSWPRSTEPASH
jgi:3-hydroxyacyl-CoA dehydrogenase/enoyl-CoA hydratase/3-hydroxybutyryl-CoA epimerase